VLIQKQFAEMNFHQGESKGLYNLISPSLRFSRWVGEGRVGATYTSAARFLASNFIASNEIIIAHLF